MIKPNENLRSRNRLAASLLLACLTAAWLCPADLPAAEGRKIASIDFARQIRPVLSDNCFSCHGPDDQTRKGGLRLDIYEEVLKVGKSGKVAVVPGKPEESELLNRIHTPDEDDIMPPAKSGKQLSLAQKGLLRQWIAEGAPWTSHWAFETPKRPALPKVKNTSWPQGDIDRFILARLEKEGLSPSPKADRATLIRRATLDLTGLPPTPAEVDAFVADKASGAYERVLDRLFKSPRYGEHMARYWLDAARYADSHGYHIDADRHMWKYRDWLVTAYNRNMPFDQFTLEQLAGDLLPEATLEQKVASGYVRANMSTGEGGAIVDEYQAKYTFDRAETTSTIWMGLTMTCARCHTHKYDPITHHEYYGLYSFFNNLKESVMDGNIPNPEPMIQVPTEEESERLKKLRAWIAEGQKRVDAPMAELDAHQAEWETRWRSKLSDSWTPATPHQFLASSNAQFKVLEDQSVIVSGPNPPQDIYTLSFKLEPGRLAGLRLEAIPDDSLPQKSSARAEDGRFRISEFEAEYVTTDDQGKPQAPKALKFVQAVADAAIKDREADKAIDGKPETGWQPVDKPTTDRHTALFLLKDTEVMLGGAELKVRMKFQASVNKRAIGRFRISAARSDELARALIPPRPQPWQVLGVIKASDPLQALDTPLEPETNLDLTKSYPGVREEARWAPKGDLEDGKDHVLVGSLHGVHGVRYLSRTLHADQDQTMEMSLRADDLFRVWVNQEKVGERLAKEKPGQGPLKTSIQLRKGTNQILVKVVSVQGDSRFRFQLSPMDESVLPSNVALLLAGTAKPTAEQQTILRAYFRRARSPEWRRHSDELAGWREEEVGLNRSIPTTLIAREEVEKPGETRILMRGEYDKPGEVVRRGTPAILPPFPTDAPTNRLGLAKWLLMPSHPLTARVNANRLWQQFFGTGIVKTSEDFGIQSEPPSHPDLIDWLATEFVQSKWNVQHLQRQIMLSAAYQQSSKHSRELSVRDPENRLLARGPRFRSDGEVIRDTALFVSGLLVERQGGRSVKPFEPSGLWEAVSFNNSQKYVPDQGEGQYRRSLYTHWKRQSPPPNMLIFDAPSREYCVVKRPRTNTPLQALALMNDPQFVEAARAFADRMLREGGPTAETRLAYGFRLATGRKPSQSELKILTQALAEQAAAFGGSPGEAEKLMAVGAYQARSKVSSAELAAWSTVASMLLNLDEALTKI